MTSFYGATSGIDVLDPYDAMILEYIEEKHITAYSLLSHRHTTVIQPAINNDIPAGIPSESCQSLNTDQNTTESGNDLPVLFPGHLALPRELDEILATRYPSSPEDDEDDVDWTVALSTYDSLEIEEMKHATARTCIPWRVLDHLADLKADTEAFADLWDLHRRADLAIESQVGAETFLGESCSGGLPGMLFNLLESPGYISEENFDINGIAPSVDALDELPGLRGLGDGI